ncbi:MAG: SAM-dependent methyltransferase [Clostridia bacterium]|nr:SAM-dependent methyltransferase [Clostridia bacterium]
MDFKETKGSVKLSGQVYTPNFIVQNILDMSGYYGKNILQKHVIDNSCGDGAFLTEIVTRYCNIAFEQRIDADIIKTELETYIHGIEINQNECKKCICRLNDIALNFGINNICWDIICADALTVTKYNGKIDYVLGNPPYVRVHNLGDNFNKIKSFSFSQGGMTDLYIVFFEIGLKMLNKTGVLGYITPSSYFNSLAGSYMRKQLIVNNLIEKIIDLQHFQAFNATTYTAITILKKIKSEQAIS